MTSGFLTASGKRLAGSDKSLAAASCTLAPMRQTGSNQMTSQETADFAVVGVFEGAVVLEANEWDFAMEVYRVVTLYLHPDSARSLAEQLTSCANGVEHAGPGDR